MKRATKQTATRQRTLHGKDLLEFNKLTFARKGSAARMTFQVFEKMMRNMIRQARAEGRNVLFALKAADRLERLANALRKEALKP